MGVILYCMVLGYLPFEDPQHIVDADYIPFEDGDHISPGMWATCSFMDALVDWLRCCAEFQDLISGIFRFEPSERLTIEQIRQHPWTNKVNIYWPRMGWLLTQK